MEIPCPLPEPVTFFAADAPPPPAFPEPYTSTKARASTRPRVLVVDDERLIASTVTAILNVNGFEAFEAFSGEEAIEAARRLRPDIILTDVLMPKMTGVELGILVSHELPETRVILFSGQAATSELMRKASASGYVFELFAKPIHPDELIAKLRQV
jgi:CheY-like chemotaxis protein